MEKKKKSNIYDSKIFWMIISLLFSLLMWTYVTSQDSSDQTRTISGIGIEFQGQQELLSEKNLSITDISAETVSITVRGSRSDISKLRAADIKAVVDVSNVAQPNNMTWTYKLSFPNYVNENDITVVSRNPETISFTVIKNSSKEIEIKGSFEGTIADGCVAEEITFEPQTLSVDGPEDVIRRIDHAYVTFGKDQTIDSAYVEEADFTLRDANDAVISKEGLVFSSDKITATQPVLKSKDVPLKVNLVSGGGVSERNCTVSIDPQTIKIAGDSRVIDEIDSIELGTVNLGSLSGSYEQTFMITLDEGIENLTGVTEARVSITINGTQTRTLTTTNIACQGVSSGYHVNIDTKEVEVTLRSTSMEALNSVSPSDVSVVADLSDYGSTTGQVIVTARVTVVGHDNVGAVGDVRVTVTIYEN